MSLGSPSPVLPKEPAPQEKTFPSSSTMVAWWEPAERSRTLIICISFVFLVFGSLSYTRVTLKGVEIPAYLGKSFKDFSQQPRPDVPHLILTLLLALL